MNGFKIYFALALFFPLMGQAENLPTQEYLKSLMNASSLESTEQSILNHRTYSLDIRNCKEGLERSLVGASCFRSLNYQFKLSLISEETFDKRLNELIVLCLRGQFSEGSEPSDIAFPAVCQKELHSRKKVEAYRRGAKPAVLNH